MAAASPAAPAPTTAAFFSPPPVPAVHICCCGSGETAAGACLPSACAIGNSLKHARSSARTFIACIDKPCRTSFFSPSFGARPGRCAGTPQTRRLPRGKPQTLRLWRGKPQTLRQSCSTGPRCRRPPPPARSVPSWRRVSGRVRRLHRRGCAMVRVALLPARRVYAHMPGWTGF